MRINITIPTYNRVQCLPQAIDSALSQVHDDFYVTVVDDGSTDGTPELMERYRDEERVVYVRLAKNLGTANAKNVSIALSPCDAMTFHDSDDIASPHKLLLQARALGLKGQADEILDWEALGIEPGSEMEVSVVVGAHRFLKIDGTVHHIDKRISLIDDFFPTLQSPSKTEGDWILVNSALFRRDCFTDLGGYLDSVEEDRELRNRLIAAGRCFHYIEEPLLTKIETQASLTVGEDTGYKSDRRKAHRNEVWRRNRLYRNGCWGPEVADKARVELNLDTVKIAEVRNGAGLRVAEDIPMRTTSRQNLERELSKAQENHRKQAQSSNGTSPAPPRQRADAASSKPLTEQPAGASRRRSVSIGA